MITSEKVKDPSIFLGRHGAQSHGFNPTSIPPPQDYSGSVNNLVFSYGVKGLLTGKRLPTAPPQLRMPELKIAITAPSHHRPDDHLPSTPAHDNHLQHHAYG